MSVATRNPFAVLDEDQPPPTPPAPPPASSPAAPTQQPPSGSAKRTRGGPAARVGKYYPRGGGSRQSADHEPSTSEDPPVAPDAKPRRFDGERRDGRGRGRGTNRGRGRTFDRHSATGKTDSEKKVHNSWGGDDGNAELKAEEAATFDAAAESGGLNDWAAPAGTPAGDWGAPVVDASTGDWGTPADTSADDWGAPQGTAPEQSPDTQKPDGARRRDRDQDEEDNTLTLDQYLAQQKEKELDLIPKLETRKANEGAGDIWEGATRLQKGEGETYFSGKTKSVPKARGEKKEKVFLEIDAHFDRPQRSGRGRGGDRGGDRGDGRGRGGRGRGGRGRGTANGTAAVAVNVDDETAFPSLV